MRTAVAILSIALGLSSALPALGVEQPPSKSATGADSLARHGDELHFVSVLTIRGEIVSVDPTNRLVTLRGPRGNTLTMEVRNEKTLEAVKPGDPVVIRYFEGAQIRKKKPGETLPAPSLKEGIVVGTLNKAMKAKRMLVASVETIDETDQEITLKGPDGSLETLMVSDPEFLGSTKVGDQVVITHVQALALSLDKES